MQGNAQIQGLLRLMGWEFATTTKYEEALTIAQQYGWKDKEVQVRVEFHDTVAYYYIEPFEKDCSCPHILKYNDHIRP